MSFLVGAGNQTPVLLKEQQILLSAEALLQPYACLYMYSIYMNTYIHMCIYTQDMQGCYTEKPVLGKKEKK